MSHECATDHGAEDEDEENVEEDGEDGDVDENGDIVFKNDMKMLPL